MDNITTLLVSISALLLAIVTLINNIYKSKKDLEETIPKKVKNQCNIDNEITNKMEELKEYLVADRVQIYDFHNGGHYANGRSALKVSCSYEVTRIGIKGHQKELQSIPLSCITQFVQTLLNKNELKVDRLEDIKETMPSTYQLKHEQEIGCFYDIILNNAEEEPIGFLAIQYTNTNCVNFDKEKQREILKLKFFIEENLEKMVTKSSKGSDKK